MRLATEKAGIKKKRQLIESQKSQRLSEQAKELKDEIEAVLKPKTAKESTTHSEAPAADVVCGRPHAGRADAPTGSVRRVRGPCPGAA